MARIRPLVAMRAMKKARENPDDTAVAIQVIGALSGNSGRRHFKRFKRSPRGAQILSEERDLYDVLTDKKRLLAMPEGSLGRTIIEWFIRENISTEGLAQASKDAAEALGNRSEVSTDEQVYGTRLRNLHDVFHVLAGYDRDLRGEVGVLAFTIAQAYNRGIAYLVFQAVRRSGWNSELGKLARQGYRRGRRAKPLVEEDWEALFERPIDEVREELGVGPPPVYEQLRSAGAPVFSS
jgi:ubiquinone biosynthesis protein COQ4